jgi:hypothetical protein
MYILKKKVSIKAYFGKILQNIENFTIFQNLFYVLWQSLPFFLLENFDFFIYQDMATMSD